MMGGSVSRDCYCLEFGFRVPCDDAVGAGVRTGQRPQMLLE
jgi:hypothetical protein